MSRPRLIALLLALTTLAVFLPVERFGYLTYDDDAYVTENITVQHGLTWVGVKWAFAGFHVANWHPLTWLSHMADCSLFGMNPGAMHFVNVLFHAANAALLFTLLWRLTQKIWPSALVAALFAWHPLHVESVAWISERKDVLSTFFALLALLNYARYVEFSQGKNPPAKVYFVGSLLAFALSLLAKPMLVTLPCLLLLLDFWPLQRLPLAAFKAPVCAKLFVEKTPFFLLAIGTCAVTVVAQGGEHAVVSLAVLPLHYRVENALAAAAGYLLKIFWPADLAVIYPFVIHPVTVVVAAATGLALISVLVWRARLSKPSWLVGWLWFLGTLVPVIGLVQVGGTAMADRYTYFPAIGIFIALAFGVPERFWLERRGQGGALLLLAVCVLLTERQLTYWRTGDGLFRHAIAITRNNLMAHLNLGLTYEQQSRYAEALAEYRQVTDIKPDYDKIQLPIGHMLEKMGRPDEALAEYRHGLRLNPAAPALHNAAGSALASQGKFSEALAEFAEAERLDSGYAKPHLGMADIFSQQGQATNAVAELWLAVKAEPYNIEILSGAAQRLSTSENTAVRDGSSAVVLALKANELANGLQPEVLDVLGMAFAEAGDFTNAVASAQNALALAEAGKSSGAEAIRRRLALYQNQQPWRESFRATNASAKP